MTDYPDNRDLNNITNDNSRKIYEEAYLFDLDGTIAYTDGLHGDMTKIGHPIPVMIEIIKEYLKMGKTVKIFTARYARRFENPNIIPAIENWCITHIGRKLDICNEKLPGVVKIYDDRCVSVKRNLGILMDANKNL